MRIPFLLILLVLVTGLTALDPTIMETYAAISPYIGVVPETTVDQALTQGMNYTVSIYTDYNGSDVYGYQFELAYNPQVLECLEFVNGDLITEDVAPVMWDPGTFNNTSGILELTTCFFFKLGLPKPLTSGPGTLAFVTFKVIGVGDSNLTLDPDPYDLYVTRLYGYTEDGGGERYNIIDAETMPDHIQHGFFSNAPDIAVTDITISLVEAKPGTIVDISVDVLNNGTVGESFNVTARYDSNDLETTIVSLEGGENTTLSVAWNTTGMAEGNYTISAYAWPVPGEMDTADNTYIDGDVRITSIIHDVAVTNVTASPRVVLAGDDIDITVTVKNKGTEIETFNVTAHYDASIIKTQSILDLAPGMEETVTLLWNTTDIAGGNYTIRATASTVPGEANVADNTLVYGEVRIVIHDVAVISITIPTTTAEVGENVTITVVVKNQGTERETFDVTIYRDAVEVETKEVTDLDPDAERTFPFVWDTTDLDAGDYTIKALASVVPGETDEENNSKTYGTFTLLPPSAAWPPMEIVIAGVAAAIAILAVSSYVIMTRRRRRKRQE